MGIIHFEQGKNVTLQHVNTGIRVNNAQKYIDHGVTGDYSFIVPANKKWTIYRITAHRIEVGEMRIYLKDPVGTYTLLNLNPSGNLLSVTEPFTIISGWEISVNFYNGVSGPIFGYLIYHEEPE